MVIKNESKYHGECCEQLRSAFEHRAVWMFLLMDEARRRGLDWDDFARKAISRCGVFHGNTKFEKTDDLVKFSEAFANDEVREIFDMDIVERTPDRFVVEFHHCPLVTGWMKQTDSAEDLEKLCDIAMDGDRGILSTFDDFEFDLQSTIAKGDDVCRIAITRKQRG